MVLRWRHALLVLALGAVALAGCNDSTHPEPEPEPRWPFPDTPDQLVANFQAVYEERDSTGYMDLLAPDFLMFLKPGTAAEFPELGDDLDVTEEATIAGHLFGGAAGHDPDGSLTSPVSSIAVMDPVQLTPWEPDPPEGLMPGVTGAQFVVLMEFNRVGDKTLQVTGVLKFYVTRQDSLYRGTLRPYYRFKALQDLTNDGWSKDNEDSAFGSVKALYR